MSEKVNALPLKAQLVWLWTIPYLDDYGCYTADPKDIKAQAFPKNKRVTVKDIARVLQQCGESGLIVLYQVAGKCYQKYLNFETFQTFRSDRSRQREYPDFEPKTANGGNGKPMTTVVCHKLSEVKLSEVKLREDTKKECVIFDRWNFYKGREKGNGKGKWKSHDEMTHEIKQAIQDRLKQYTPEQLVHAIDNYAKVLLSKEYTWTYAWTLRQFLTRHQKTPNQSELQLYRWLDSGFAEDDYLSPAAKARRVTQARQGAETPADVVADPEKVAQMKERIPCLAQKKTAHYGLESKEAKERRLQQVRKKLLGQ